MKSSIRHAITPSEVFGLERISEPNGRISRSEDGELYLFTCSGLLQEGQRIFINEHQEMIGTYQDNTILVKTHCNEIEISVLTALALSFPYSVDKSQMLTIYALHQMNSLETENGASDEHFLPLELITTCNERLMSLGIGIVLNETAYHMVALRK